MPVRDGFLKRIESFLVIVSGQSEAELPVAIRSAPVVGIKFRYAALWLVGIAALLIYTLVSFLRLKSKIGTAVLLKENIYQSENISSPFVLGVIKPKIYLPFYMNERDIPPVVLAGRP